MEQFKLLIALILLGGITGIWVPGYAGSDDCEFNRGPEPSRSLRFSGRHEWRFALPFRELALTDEQKAQLKSWLEEQGDQNQERMDAIRKIHREMHELITADTIDEAAIRAKAGELAKAQADQAIEHARFMQRVRTILTPEQLDRLKATEERHHKHMMKQAFIFNPGNDD